MLLLSEKSQTAFAVAFSVITISSAAFGLHRIQSRWLEMEIPLRSGEKFVDYTKWRRVNPTLAQMDYHAMLVCFVPMEQRRERERNPHFGKWIAVYVNGRAEDAMLKQAVPKFPVGSIIVKEKRWAQEETEKPELLTVMTKMPEGYDPAHGDWQYMGVEGGSRTIQARGRMANCQSCHDTKAGTDYVYRDYLPTPL